jgi:hypothetical protein
MKPIMAYRNGNQIDIADYPEEVSAVRDALV